MEISTNTTQVENHAENPLQQKLSTHPPVLPSLDCKTFHEVLEAIRCGTPLPITSPSIYAELSQAKLVQFLNETELVQERQHIETLPTFDEWSEEAQGAVSVANARLEGFRSLLAREARAKLGEDDLIAELQTLKALIGEYLDKVEQYEPFLQLADENEERKAAYMRVVRRPTGAAVLTPLGECYSDALKIALASGIDSPAQEFLSGLSGGSYGGLREASCFSVLELCASLSGAKEAVLEPEQVTELKELGLVEVYPLSLKREMEQSLNELNVAKANQRRLYTELLMVEEELDYYSRQRPGMFAGGRKAQISSAIDRLSAKSESLSEQLEELNIPKLTSEVETVENLIGIGGGWFIRLTAHYEAVADRLRTVLPHVLREPFGKFLESCVLPGNAVDVHLKRVGQMLEAIEAMHDYDMPPHPVLTAVILSNTFGNTNDLVKRFFRFSDELSDLGWTEDGRFRVAAILAARRGSYADIINDLSESTDYLIGEQDFNEKYSTLYEASRMLDVEGGTLEDKFNRFQTVRALMAEQGWKRRGAPACLAGMNLAASKRDPRVLTLEMIDLQREIEKIVNRTDCVEIGFAALILVEHSAGKVAALNSFEEIWQELQQSGFDAQPRNFEVAALLTLVPGDAKQKIGLLIKIGKELKGKNCLNLTSVAASLLFGATWGDYYLDASHRDDHSVNFKRHLSEGVASIYADRCGGEDLDERELAPFK